MITKKCFTKSSTFSMLSGGLHVSSIDLGTGKSGALDINKKMEEMVADLERPKPGKWDKGHTAAKIILAGIPYFGGSAAELFSAVIAPPLEKRRNQWLNDIVERLKLLEKESNEFRIESLSQNEAFITIMLHATQAAIRNHQQEKLEALRNAILNAAISKSPEDDMQLMFLNFVNEFTSYHLRILHFFDDPESWGKRHNISYPKNWVHGNLFRILGVAFEELKERRDFCDQVVQDLYNKGLMGTESLHGIMTVEDMFVSRTTEMGKEFLAFISSPNKKGS